MPSNNKQLSSKEIARVFSDSGYSNYLSFKGLGYMWIYDACLENEDSFISMKSNLDTRSKLIMLADSLMGVVREAKFSNKNIENLRLSLNKCGILNHRNPSSIKESCIAFGI